MIVTVGNASIDRVRLAADENVQIGGAAIYSAVAAARFGKACAVACVGDDYPPEYLGAIKDAGVDVSCIKRKKGKTTRFSIEYDDNLTARYLSKEYGVSKAISPKDVPSRLLEKNNAFHIAPLTPTKQLNFVRHVKKRSPRSLVSVNAFLPFVKKYRSRYHNLINAADVFILNEAEAMELASVPRLDAAIKAFSSHRDTLIIMTMGGVGSVILKNRVTQFAPSVYSARIKDPTGAGDSFSGAFLASYNQVRDPIRAAIVGNAIASMKGEAWSFDNLVGLKFRDADELWSYIMLRSKSSKSQALLTDFS